MAPIFQLPIRIELFTKHRVHRILVLEHTPARPGDSDADQDDDAVPQQDPKGRLVSQTDVIRYLLEHNHELGPILDIPADSAAGHALRFSDEYLDTATADRLKHTPASITISSPAWAGLQKMSTTHASCVAIVGTVPRWSILCSSNKCPLGQSSVIY